MNTKPTSVTLRLFRDPLDPRELNFGLSQPHTDSESPTETGEVLRDKGLEKVSTNNSQWLEKCLSAITSTNWGERGFTGEEIREEMQLRGLNPSHHNAWGALISVLVKRGIITRTGERRKMRDPQSHARLTDVYTFL